MPPRIVFVGLLTSTVIVTLRPAGGAVGWARAANGSAAAISQNHKCRQWVMCFNFRFAIPVNGFGEFCSLDRVRSPPMGQGRVEVVSCPIGPGWRLNSFKLFGRMMNAEDDVVFHRVSATARLRA
jgi:hypothetical protein